MNFFRSFLRVIRIACAATDAQLQSIGEQAFQRVKVANLIARGGSTNPSCVDGAIVFEISGGFIRFECGFLNRNDAKDFLAKLAQSRSQLVAAAVPYSQSPAHYRLDGWVGTLPPRCNASYYDWGSDKNLRVVLDLGPVQAIEPQQVE